MFFFFDKFARWAFSCFCKNINGINYRHVLWGNQLFSVPKAIYHKPHHTIRICIFFLKTSDITNTHTAEEHFVVIDWHTFKIIYKVITIANDDNLALDCIHNVHETSQKFVSDYITEIAAYYIIGVSSRLRNTCHFICSFASQRL